MYGKLTIDYPHQYAFFQPQMLKYLIEQGLDVDHVGKHLGVSVYVVAYTRYPITLFYYVFGTKVLIYQKNTYHLPSE
jgi:hypothetical protein